MKKIKIKKIKFPKSNLKGAFNYIINIIISSVIVALVLISLPLTEKFTYSASYDLVNKGSMYWSKEYILEIDKQESKNIKAETEEIRSVIQKRLRKVGVEQSNVVVYEQDDKQYIRVEVQTSKEKDVVENLIKSPFMINIVTRKDDVNYEDEENPLTPYLEESYNKTDFTRDSFRNVYITNLKNSAGEYSYFGIYKTWPWQREWNTFMEENAGQVVGVSIDGFVTPVQINAGDATFASSVSVSEEKYAKLMDILYNSGVVPLTYSVITEEDTVVDIAEIDYIKLTQGILAAILFIYLYLLVVEKTEKRTLLLSAISSIITVAAWIAYLKISKTPVDIFLLAIEVLTMIVVIRAITENIESRINITILITAVCILSTLLGSGYVRMFGNDMLLLIILSNLSLILSSYYITNVKKSLKI